jgi:hypothetical protein
VFEKGVLRRYFGLKVRRRQDTGENFVMRSFMILSLGKFWRNQTTGYKMRGTYDT